MKKIIVIFIFATLLIPTILTANPYTKSNFLLSLPVISYEQKEGELHENEDGDGQTKFEISLGKYETGIQYFVIDNLSVGAYLGYSSMEQGDISTSQTTIGPMVKYFFQVDKFYPYLGLTYLYMPATTKNSETDTETEYTDSSIKILGGCGYMLYKSIGAYAELAYGVDNREPDQGDTIDGSTIGITLGVFTTFSLF